MTFDILLSCCCVKSNKVLCKHLKNEVVYSWHINLLIIRVVLVS